METMSQRHPIAVFSGTGNPALAEAIAQRLGIPLGGLRITRFPDTEVYVKFEESVRGSDVFLIQPTCAPIDGNLMELLIMLDACKRASAGSISAVVPYFGYARQDRKAAPRGVSDLLADDEEGGLDAARRGVGEFAQHHQRRQRRQAARRAVMHEGEGVLDMAGEAFGVEGRGGADPRGELRPQRAQPRRIPRQRHRHGPTRKAHTRDK